MLMQVALWCVSVIILFPPKYALFVNHTLSLSLSITVSVCACVSFHCLKGCRGFVNNCVVCIFSVFLLFFLCVCCYAGVCVFVVVDFFW